MKNLVFTSAGDNTKFYDDWLTPENIRTFDLYVIYYGKDENKYELYKSKATWIEKREGSKFQNFAYLYKTYAEKLVGYERLFILDDDIQMNAHDINKMFEISYKYNLSICQPSFTKESILSHGITRHKPKLLLQYTNFVEVNTPLFTRAALDKLMLYYNDNLIGWGIDYLYIWANGLDLKNAYAVIHSVKCVNPSKMQKGIETREILLCKKGRYRRNIWEKYADSIKCPREFKLLRYDSIPITFPEITPGHPSISVPQHTV